MIETHVLNALLAPALKERWLFPILTFVNGLVAPAFLFCAGFALAISLTRKWTLFVRFSPQSLTYIRRLLFILVVAYSLHTPFFSFQQFLTLSDDLWISFFQVDILQVISVTLLFITLLVLVTRNERVLYSILTALMLGVVFSTPFIRNLDWSGYPVWLRAYFTAAYGSQFPLFPWSAFVMAGALVGRLFIGVESEQRSAIILKFLFYSLGVIGLSLCAELLPFDLYPGSFWNSSPQFFFARAGLVVLLLSLIFHAGSKGTSAFFSSNIVQTFGQESLLVYVVHLLLVYSRKHDFSLLMIFGSNLNYGQVFGLFAALTVIMWGMARIWHDLKSRKPGIAMAVQWTILSLTILFFLLNYE